MRVLIDITEWPPGMGFTYGDLRFAKFGVGRWRYAWNTATSIDQWYCGEPEWINWEKFSSIPKMRNPKAFEYWFYPGVKGSAQMVPELNHDIADAYIQGIAVNLLRGKGIAF